MNWVDIVAAVNMILILGSFFLAVGIISSLRGANAYILAKGWPYILVAVLIFSIIKVYEFFTEYAIYTFPRFLKEGLQFFFIACIFYGLMVQYLAIQEVIDQRSK